jgi:hypothetical protein
MGPLFITMSGRDQGLLGGDLSQRWYVSTHITHNIHLFFSNISAMEEQLNKIEQRLDKIYTLLNDSCGKQGKAGYTVNYRKRKTKNTGKRASN